MLEFNTEYTVHLANDKQFTSKLHRYGIIAGKEVLHFKTEGNGIVVEQFAFVDQIVNIERAYQNA